MYTILINHIHYICFLSVLSNQSSALLYYIKIFHPETVSLLSSPCSSREGHLSTCFLVHSRSWVPLWCLASKCPLRRDHRSSPFLQREISCSPRRLPPSRSCQHRQVRTKGSVAQLATTSTSSQRKNVLVLRYFVAGKSPGGVSARGHPGEPEGEQSGQSACRRRRALHLWGERIGFNADIQRGF